jgi:3-hydroxyisobutyrate dehydrogenase-like beta-hydroxyacid dehydrogenase
VKDVAKEIGADLQFSNKALDYFSKLEKEGEGGKDFSIVYQMIHQSK